MEGGGARESFKGGGVREEVEWVREGDEGYVGEMKSEEEVKGGGVKE